MGAAFAEVSDRLDLAAVLTELKSAKAIEGAPYTTAQGYLKFRNDALHAGWSKVDAPLVASCIAYVEGLVLKHFA